MKNEFIMKYAGNKRQEVEEIYKNLNLDDVDTICEPFCGTSSMSYYISTKHPLKFKYILNDLNKHLIKLYHLIKDPIKYNYFNVLCEMLMNHIHKQVNKKEEWDIIININDVYSYYINNAYHYCRPGIFNEKCSTYKNFKKRGIINFLRTEDVLILNETGTTITEKYSQKKNILLLLDPPYLMTNNGYYLGDDLFGIYDYLLSITNKNNNIILIIEYSWIIKHLFKNYNIIKYGKKYAGYKPKEVLHCLIYI